MKKSIILVLLLAVSPVAAYAELSAANRADNEKGYSNFNKTDKDGIPLGYSAYEDRQLDKELQAPPPIPPSEAGLNRE